MGSITTDGSEEAEAQVFPSVDDAEPSEQGGPIARNGFNYQDEIAASFFIEALRDPSIIKIHCETHDDIVVVTLDGEEVVAEFVQVKGEKPDQLWSIAKLCEREKGKPGKSIFEVSLQRDRHKEISRFRLVTLRDVAGALAVLKYPMGSPARTPDCDDMQALRKEIEERCPDATSPKGNGAEFWCRHCVWDQRESIEFDKVNAYALVKLSHEEGRGLLPEQAEVLLDELRAWAKRAADSPWKPNPGAKIVTRQQLRAWWEARTDEIISGASTSAGGKLRIKLSDAALSDEVIRMATDLRLGYAAAVRTSRYMDDGDAVKLQERVKSELLSLRARHTAGLILADGPKFHAMCLDRLDEINQQRPADTDDRSAFMKGCMYDITDRCMHRFARPDQ